MNYEKILVPTDFSASAQEAVDYASRLAHASGAELLFLHVEAVPDIPGADDDVEDANLPILEKRLKQVEPQMSGIRFEHRLVIGHPSDAILRVAEKDAFDLIVMGLHGQTDSPDAAMGAVARGVVDRSPKPVLLVKVPSRNATPVGD